MTLGIRLFHKFSSPSCTTVVTPASRTHDKVDVFFQIIQQNVRQSLSIYDSALCGGSVKAGEEGPMNAVLEKKAASVVRLNADSLKASGRGRMTTLHPKQQASFINHSSIPIPELEKQTMSK